MAEYFKSYYHNNESRRNAHKARVKANKVKNRVRDLAKKYNTTESKIQSLLKANDGMCAICNKKEATVIDHCHKNGSVRGALCHGCNVGLGFFEDNPDILLLGAQYLRAVYPLPDKE